MSNYPPPPRHDHQHYTALYPAPATAQQLLDPAQQEQFQFTGANAVNSPSTQHIRTLAQELSHHASLEDHQRHQNLLPPPAQFQPPITIANHSNQTPHMPTPLDQQSQKLNRLRKACDSCSIRKVKCDEAGPPCKACVALDIPCTFDRPSRRRGPPNRHADAIKRRRLDGHPDAVSPSMSGMPSPSSPAHAAQALAALSAHSFPPLAAEAICPIETLDLLIDDFFTYMHPLCPFPHEPGFREAWKRREDASNKSFLALLSSMIGALVASFPRKPRLHLKTQNREPLFPDATGLIQRCQQVCAAARGPGYLENDNLNVYDAGTSYFLALMGIYTCRWRLGRLYFGECWTILRALGLHKPHNLTYNQLGMTINVPDDTQPDVQNGNEVQIDNITSEMARRIFWTMFVTVKSMEQLGANFGELVIPPPTPTEPYPPMATEVDDFCIYPTMTDSQPSGLVSMMAGFNANVRVYCSFNALDAMEMAGVVDGVVDWDRQKRVLHESLRQCKAATADLPQDLLVDIAPGVDTSDGNASFHPSFTQPQPGRDPASSLMSVESRPSLELSLDERRRSQYEIQKTTMYASSLATLLYIVDKYWALNEARRQSQSQGLDAKPGSSGGGAVSDGPDDNPDDEIAIEMRSARETTVKDLLLALSSLDQVNMEPNANSFVSKLRAIASTLLDIPDHRKGQLALQAQNSLASFLETLKKLEDLGPTAAHGHGDGQAEDGDAELQMWTELRGCQIKFAQLGGLPLDLS